MFESLLEAQILIEKWRRDYNTVRPHSALGCTHACRAQEPDADAREDIPAQRLFHTPINRALRNDVNSKKMIDVQTPGIKVRVMSAFENERERIKVVKKMATVTPLVVSTKAVYVPAVTDLTVADRPKILFRTNISLPRSVKGGRRRATNDGRPPSFRLTILPSIGSKGAAFHSSASRQSPTAISSLGAQLDAGTDESAALGPTQGLLLTTGRAYNTKTSNLTAAATRLNVSFRRIISAETQLGCYISTVLQIPQHRRISPTFWAELHVPIEVYKILLMGKLSQVDTTGVNVKNSVIEYPALTTIRKNFTARASVRVAKIGVGPHDMASDRRPVKGAILAVAAQIPVVDNLILSARLSKMTRSLAMLIEAGLPLVETLRLTRRCTASTELVQLLEGMEMSLPAGQNVTQPHREARGVPRLLSDLIRAGRETGNMATRLTQAAQVFEEETRIALDRVLVLLEPAIIVMIPFGVGGQILVVIGALMSVNSLFIHVKSHRRCSEAAAAGRQGSHWWNSCWCWAFYSSSGSSRA